MAQNTEEKIKKAARQIFKKKGFDKTSIKDISDAAGTNVALVNYYYRSKQNLYDEIMVEEVRHFFSVILNLYDSDLDLRQKLICVGEAYIDHLMEEPELQQFIINGAWNNPKMFEQKVLWNKDKVISQISVIMKTYNLSFEQIVHILLGLLSMAIFPFTAKPILAPFLSIEDKQYKRIIYQVKTKMPEWVDSLMQINSVPTNRD